MVALNTWSSKCSTTMRLLSPWRQERITLSRWWTELLSEQRWPSRTKSLLLLMARQLLRRSRCYKMSSSIKVWRRRICKLTLWASSPRSWKTIELWTNLNRSLEVYRTYQEVKWLNLLKLQLTKYHQPRLRYHSLRRWWWHFNSRNAVSILSTGSSMTRQKSSNTSSWISFILQNGRLTIWKI